VLIVFGAALYPLTATSAKIKDRMATEAPHTLDGMDYMAYSYYGDLGETFSLEEDYRAILWMQDNVQGSPVIVEANTPEYRWGSRFTIYTGLPGVLGWNWHQRQQRAAVEEADVMERARQINDFYLTRSMEEAYRFINRFDVRYIVIGKLENIYFNELYPCQTLEEDPSIVTCDMSGRPVGMVQPELSASECRPKNPDYENSNLICPTHAFDKFDTMHTQGLIRVVYQDGDTVIYEVIG
jgi:uncharacterized membrane protein